ncbi:RIP metalloprotease RseP [Campylobacter mucosalis]|uniref:RIP metalloprotease RseP n=1 Tax=Campylobacter mucosalis TaxID=202 RepID=UPI00146FDD5F|nr:RIP metalloprotease RseP [Campylobacter mucosalis]
MKSVVFVVALLAVGIYFYSWYIFATILVLSFLVFFHELGHFLVARMLGVCVNTFSIGFGQKLIKKRIGQTEYAISAIPLGGYVQLKGQDDSDPRHKNYDPDSYNSVGPLGRIAILFAGPFFNFILAFFIFIAIGFMGVDKFAPVVGKVLEGSAGASANLKSGDKILYINDVLIKEWDDIKKNVKTEPTTIQIERNNQIINLTLTPKISQGRTMFGEIEQRAMIGISPSGDVVKLYYGGFDAVKYAYKETIEASKLIFLGLKKLVEGVVPLKEVGGIVQITDITAKAAKSDFVVLLIITALLSVNLGVLNLLPIPALDGGHIVFNLYELIFRREVSEKAFTYLTYFGWAILFSLMILATFNDVMRLSEGVK